jgi:mannose-6-phosphate isomerase-like protein (cupin superfamily)
LLEHVLGSADSDLRLSEHRHPGDPNGLPRRGVPLHRHRTEDEAWYVLEGRLRFQFGDEEFEAAAGSGVLLPHGTPHTFWNPGPEAVRYLLIVRPKTAGLLDALHVPDAPRPSNLRPLYDSFDVDLVE